MDRRISGSLAHARQHRSGSAPSSPAHPLSMVAAAGSVGGLANGKRASSRAAAANARLAQVMTRKRPEYDAYDEEEDAYPIPSIVGGGAGRYRSGSPRLGSARGYGIGASAAVERAPRNPSPLVAAEEDDDDILNPAAGTGPVTGGSVRFGLKRPVDSSNGGGSGASFGRAARCPLARGNCDRNVPSFFILGRNFIEPAPATRASTASRPLSIRTSAMVPPTKSMTRTSSPVSTIDPSVDRQRDKRFFPEMRQLTSMGSGNLREASALQDKVDMLEEENYNLLEKLQLAEEKRKETEDKTRELEKQVANLGEGVCMEARLLGRKEAALRQREVAIKAAMRMEGKGEEITALQQEVQAAKDEVATTVEQLRNAELEVQALRNMTQRMILTQEEMEEVVLKRCWLARYWALAVRHGIYPEIATDKHEYWSSLAPLPLEVVTSAGQRAKRESWSSGYYDSDRTNKHGCDISDTTAEVNIENMLAVEKGLRELASLKVEDAVVLDLAQHRRPNFLRQFSSDSSGDPKFVEELELSEEEAEDVLFKQSWLTYFWRRAKTYGVEEDLAEERLHFWIDRIGRSPTTHDVLDVDRGLIELRKLGIERQLWEASRRETDISQKPPSDAENS